MTYEHIRDEQARIVHRFDQLAAESEADRQAFKANPTRETAEKVLAGCAARTAEYNHLMRREAELEEQYRTLITNDIREFGQFVEALYRTVEQTAKSLEAPNA